MPILLTFLFNYRDKMYLWHSKIKAHELIYRQLQLVFGAVNRKMLNTKECLVFIFAGSSALACVLFFSFKIYKSPLGIGTTHRIITALSNLIFSLVLIHLQLTLGKLMCSVTAESVNYKNSINLQRKSFLFSKGHCKFIKSCPAFQLILGHCLKVDNQMFLRLTQDSTLNLLATLLFTYR